jgi:hypothetical protein
LSLGIHLGRESDIGARVYRLVPSLACWGSPRALGHKTNIFFIYLSAYA